MAYSRDAAVRSHALRLQPFCRRCINDTKAELRAHHIVALADGGIDEIDNIDVLCSTCHLEWHHFAEGVVDYEEFCATIPARYMQVLHQKAECDDQTLLGVRFTWLVFRNGRLQAKNLPYLKEALQGERTERRYFQRRAGWKPRATFELDYQPISVMFH